MLVFALRDRLEGNERNSIQSAYNANRCECVCKHIYCRMLFVCVRVHASRKPADRMKQMMRANSWRFAFAVWSVQWQKCIKTKKKPVFVPFFLPRCTYMHMHRPRHMRSCILHVLCCCVHTVFFALLPKHDSRTSKRASTNVIFYLCIHTKCFYFNWYLLLIFSCSFSPPLQSSPSSLALPHSHIPCSVSFSISRKRC